MPSASRPARTSAKKARDASFSEFGKARRADQDLAVARVLAVQDAQRVALEPVPAVLGQLVAVPGQIADQLIAIGTPARRIAQTVQLQHDLVGEAELGQNPRAERDHLDVGERLRRAQDLDVDLMELAQPALLRPLVAEHRAAREQPDRQLLAERAGDERARDAGGVLGAQRQAVAAPVLERVHLLGDDVRGLAERAREHLGELEHRRRDLGIAVAGRDRAPGLDHLAMAERGLADDVVGAADGAKAGHGVHCPMLRARHARLFRSGLDRHAALQPGPPGADR